MKANDWFPVWSRRSRIEQGRKKLRLLRSKRGRSAQGDSLLKATDVSLRRGDARSAGNDLDRFALVVTDLCPEERALVESIRLQLACNANNWQLWSVFVRALTWLVSHIVFLGGKNPLNYAFTPLQLLGSS